MLLLLDKWHQCIPTAAHPAHMPWRVHWRLQWTFAVRVFVECGSLQCPWLVSNQTSVGAVCLLITAIVIPVESRAYTSVQCSSTPTLACASMLTLASMSQSQPQAMEDPLFLCPHFAAILVLAVKVFGLHI
jgi:hypothetical protein